MPQASLHTFLTPNKTKLQKPEVFQTKTPSTKEHSCAKTTKYTPTVMKTTSLTFTTCKPKPGPKSEINYINQIKIFEIQSPLVNL